MKTVKVVKSGSKNEERMFVDPPYTIFGHSGFIDSYSFIMKVGGLREMLKGLKDEDSFRVEIFPRKATEYSFIKHKK